MKYLSGVAWSIERSLPFAALTLVVLASACSVRAGGTAVPPSRPVAPATATAEALAGSAMGLARWDDERSARSVDVRLTTVGEAIELLGNPDMRNLGRMDRRVYVVRIGGRFAPYDGPPASDGTWPRRGTVYAIYDAGTGDELAHGSDTTVPPASP